jgi:hypothetical protein
MRIVAISDQHGFLPDIPPCDLLIIAGDVCPDALDGHFAADRPDLQKAWFDRTIRPWLAASPASHKLLTWGNHDWCGEACDFHSDWPPAASSQMLQILLTRETTIPRSDGGRPIRVWASPWSNQFGDWAFMRAPRDLASVYDAIPEGIDVLVSHQPPYGYCDAVPDFRTGHPSPQGSRQLLAAIDRVRPRVVICGHIHEGHGEAERDGTRIYNVSVVDEYYRLVHSATLIDI